jgi:HEAT repeat protein
MKSFVIVLAIILAIATVPQINAQNVDKQRPAVLQVSQTEKQEWETLQTRFKNHWPRLSGMLWGLIHTYESKSEMERSLNLFQSIALTIASKDPASIRKFNGPQGFKQQLVGLMGSEDDTVSSFAALLLAFIGDQEYAPRIAALLSRHSDLPADKYPPITVRGRAAIALAFLGANQYTDQIVSLLKSPNDYDRSGAAMALGYLKATEHAKDVADLLLKKDFDSHDDDTPIQALVEMGVAANYKKEMAQVLREEHRWETAKSAAYCLAHLGAKEHAADIATRLDDIGKGNFAKALALMGAKEYASKIAPMLAAERAYDQGDGALALGILEAKESIPNIASLLKAQDRSTRYTAALSLVLLEADGYAKQAVTEIEARHRAGAYFDTSDFHEFVKDEVFQLDLRFRKLLARMKAKLPTRRQRGLNSKRRLRHT